jgi:hypothetical protein
MAGEYKKQGVEMFQNGHYQAAADAFAKGIKVVDQQQTGNEEFVSLRVSLRSNRAASFLEMARGDGSKEQERAWAEEVVIDCTAVVDMPADAAPGLLVKVTNPGPS